MYDDYAYIYIYKHMGFMWYGEYMSGSIIYYVAFQMRKFLRGLYKNHLRSIILEMIGNNSDRIRSIILELIPITLTI